MKRAPILIRRLPRHWFSVVLWLLAMTNCFLLQAQPSRNAHPTQPVRMEMHNLTYHFTEQVVVRIFDLQGELTPTKDGAIVFFDDKYSFQVAVESARIALSTGTMANVMNQHVFDAADAPLKQIAISVSQDRLKIKGKLHSKADVPFETDGSLSVTPEGEIRIHAEKIRAAHLPVKGLMDLLDLKISDVLSTRKVAGIRTDGDDLIVSPEIFPPPRMQGKITAVKIEGSQIILTFGSAAAKPQLQQPGNYIAFRGSRLRFGKLTMDDTDMVLTDMDPRDPFDFFLDHYPRQLQAGYTKITAAWGLRVFMRDFSKLKYKSE